MTLAQIIDLAGAGAGPAPETFQAAADFTAKAIENTSIDEIISHLIANLTAFVLHLAAAILVFYIGKFIITKLYNLVAAIMLRRKIDRSLSTFVLSLIKIALYFILIVTVIGILGIETSSFIAIFASAGVAVGMALSGTLQNFAGGVLILLLKPYKIGDYIEAQGYAGTVTEIQIFHTIICTPDNKSIIIPNGGLSTGSINNYSREDYRRLEWKVGISYGNSVEDARKAILDIINSDERIVKLYIEEDREMKCDPDKEDCEAPQPKRSWLWRMLHRQRQHVQAVKNADTAETLKRLKPRIDCSPKVFLAELADSSVNLSARAWVKSGDYWGAYYDINERIYNELPKAGCSFPFPQMDVHIKKQETA